VASVWGAAVEAVAGAALAGASFDADDVFESVFGGRVFTVGAGVLEAGGRLDEEEDAPSVLGAVAGEAVDAAVRFDDDDEPSSFFGAVFVAEAVGDVVVITVVAVLRLDVEEDASSFFCEAEAASVGAGFAALAVGEAVEAAAEGEAAAAAGGALADAAGVAALSGANGASLLGVAGAAAVSGASVVFAGRALGVDCFVAAGCAADVAGGGATASVTLGVSASMLSSSSRSGRSKSSSIATMPLHGSSEAGWRRRRSDCTDPAWEGRATDEEAGCGGQSRQSRVRSGFLRREALPFRQCTIALGGPATTAGRWALRRLKRRRAVNPRSAE
jgi:hypothetical protein